jgi:tetratricopeptide (TPR) repeat protein
MGSSFWSITGRLLRSLLHDSLALTGEAPTPAPSGVEIVDAASKTFSLLATILVVAALIPVVFIIYRKFFQTLRSVSVRESDPREEATRLEKKGDYPGAAAASERMGDYSRAAVLYEKGRDFTRAAEMYEKSGSLKKAAELHLRSGGSAKAAGLYVKAKEYVEAAKIFKNKGDHLRAAQALEIFGSKAAAAREYKSAGDFERAAMLMKMEGMHAEAAETYALSLEGEALDHASVDRFYTYAAHLALAHEETKAARIYASILALKGEYRKVRGNLKAIGFDEQGQPLPKAAAGAAVPPSREAEAPLPSDGRPAAAEIDGSSGPEDGVAPGKTMTLRKMMAGGGLETKYSMRLWVQIVKALSEEHRANTFYGCLTPDSIFIDMQNNITITSPKEKPQIYTAPEVLSGEVPGPYSDIYAMGVILFEMVTGSLDRLGEERPKEVRDDIPHWLDGFIIKCTKRDRRDRFLNADDISATLTSLSQGPRSESQADTHPLPPVIRPE